MECNLMIKIAPGKEVSFPQAAEINRRIDELGKENCHWHFNECGCCVTIHGKDCAYVIGRDGGATRFEKSGCQCE